MTSPTPTLVERLRNGRLVRASEPLNIADHGIAWSGEVREMAHPDAHEAAEAIEAMDCTIRQLREALEMAPIPGYDECPRAFRKRSDEWLAGPYRNAFNGEP